MSAAAAHRGCRRRCRMRSSSASYTCAGGPREPCAHRRHKAPQPPASSAEPHLWRLLLPRSNTVLLHERQQRLLECDTPALGNAGWFHRASRTLTCGSGRPCESHRASAPKPPAHSSSLQGGSHRCPAQLSQRLSSVVHQRATHALCAQRRSDVPCECAGPGALNAPPQERLGDRG
jgi:hypothetical protein